jgi:hypothetical protein
MIRHLFTAVLVTALVASPTPAQAQAQAGNVRPASGEPVVSVGLFNRRPDGTVSGSASSTGSAVGEDFSGTVSMSPCTALSASSYNRIPAAATDAWKLGGQVTAFNESSVSLSLTWRRVREGGKDVQGAEQSRTFTLPMGGRDTLDTLDSPTLGSCPEHRVTFDVAFDRRPVATQVSGGGYNSVVTGARAGSGRVNTSSAPTSGVTHVGGAAAGGGGGGLSALPAAPAGGGAKPAGSMRPFPIVDLWLVHTAPGQPDRTEHQQAQAAPFTRAATFPPSTITTSTGVFTITVECYVEDGLSPAGEPRLFVSASRKVSYAPSSGQARDVRPVIEGSIKTAVERPGPNDVLSFELPVIQYPGAPSVPDRFSIRLKLAS